jgi:hypothetical protein
MKTPQQTDPLTRLACAAGAMVATIVIGLGIHALARSYEAVGETLATAQPSVVALAAKR